MRNISWSLFILAACGGGTSSSSSSPSGGDLFAVEGLTNGALTICVAGHDVPESLLVRNVSATSIKLRVDGRSAGRPMLPQLVLAAGASEILTLGPPGIGDAGTYLDGSIEISASTDLSTAASAMAIPGSARTQTVSIPVHFDVDDRAYVLSSDASRVLGHQLGFVTWTTADQFSLPTPKLVLDGPFEFSVSPSITGKPAQFRLAAGGPPGEEVKGSVSVAKSRCSQKPLPEPAPVPLSGRRADVAKAVATGALHSCALDIPGRVFCWGDDASGQLARPPGSLLADASAEPLLVAGLAPVGAIAAGRAHTCALRSGEVFCWGDSTLGQCGPGAAAVTATPNKVALGGLAMGVAARGDRSCAIMAEGAVTCWGRDAAGTAATAPASLPNVTGAAQVALGDAHVCTRSATGTVQCSGAGGRIGDGTTSASETPVQIMTDVTTIAAGSTHTCALTKAGALMCWGDLPDGSTGPAASWLTPKLLDFHELDPAFGIAAAGRTTCRGGTRIECTDNNGSITPHISAFDTGGSHLCGIFDGGKVTCNGNNARHQLGPGEVSGIYGFDGL